MDNFSKLMADLLGKGKTLEEAMRAASAKAELSAHLGYRCSFPNDVMQNSWKENSIYQHLGVGVAKKKANVRMK